MVLPHKCVALSMAAPIILSLYLGPLNVSTPIFMATNSVPMTPVSNVACLLEYQSTRAVLTSLWEYLVCLSPAWLLSTNMQISTGLPRGFREFGGIDSSNPLLETGHHQCQDMLDPYKDISCGADLGKPWCAKQNPCNLHVTMPNVMKAMILLIQPSNTQFWSQIENKMLGLGWVLGQFQVHTRLGMG